MKVAGEDGHKMTYGDKMPLDLLAVADNVSVEVYNRAITEEERATLSSGVTELSIREEDVTDEKKEAVASYNATLKAIKLEKKGSLRSLRSGRTEVEEEVFTYFDHEAIKTYKYDSKGDLISVKRMTPTEAQLQIK